MAAGEARRDGGAGGHGWDFAFARDAAATRTGA